MGENIAALIRRVRKAILNDRAKAGGTARARKLSSTRKSEIARKAAKARWAKPKKEK